MPWKITRYAFIPRSLLPEGEETRRVVVARHASAEGEVMEVEMGRLAEAIKAFAKEEGISLEGIRIINSSRSGPLVRGCGKCLGREMGIPQEVLDKDSVEIAESLFDEGPELAIMIVEELDCTERLTPNNKRGTRFFMERFWSDDEESFARPIIVHLPVQNCEKIW